MDIKDLCEYFAQKLPFPHFQPREYLYDSKFQHWAQIDMPGENSRRLADIAFKLQPLLTNLEDVRSHFGHPVIITNGIRDHVLWKMLKNAGYSPSPRTDHSYGLPYNPYGVGAIDHYVVGVPIEDVYEYERSAFSQRVGQLILYKKSKFIHMSNSRELVYTPEFIASVFSRYEKYILWEK